MFLNKKLKTDNTNIFENLWNKDYIIVMFASAGMSFCNYFFFSTLPIYVEKISGTINYSGFITGIYTLSAFAVRPVSGILSDKFKRTKLLIFGAFLCSTACLLYNFTSVLVLLILIRVIHGIGFGIHSTSGGAVAADVIPKSRMAEGFGFFGLYGTIAAAVAPGIALSIIKNGETQNFKFLFLLAAIISLGSMIFDCFITYESKDKKQVIHRKSLASVPNKDRPETFLGFEYAVFLPSAVLLLIYVALSCLISFLPLFALEKKLGNISIFFTLYALGMFISRIIFGKLTDRYGADFVVIPGTIILAFCFLLIPFSNSRVHLFYISVPLGLAFGAVSPALNTLIFNRCSPVRRGTASAAYFSSIDIGYGAGSIGLGFLAAAFGYSFIYFVAMGLTILALLVYLLGISKKFKIK